MNNITRCGTADYFVHRPVGYDEVVMGTLLVDDHEEAVLFATHDSLPMLMYDRFHGDWITVEDDE